MLRNILLSVVIIFLTSSCSSKTYKLYDGVDLPKDEVSIIKTQSDRLSILSVDDKNLESEPKEVHVLPGKHTVKVQYKSQSIKLRFTKTRSSTKALEILAEPGYEHLISDQKDGYKYVRFITTKSRIK